MKYTKIKHYRKDEKKFTPKAKHMPKVIRKLSRGLVKVVDDRDDDDGASHAHFAHPAIKAYLLAEGLSLLSRHPAKDKKDHSAAAAAAAAAAATRAHLQLSRSCIRYLALKDIRTHLDRHEPSRLLLLHLLPLAPYALTSLPHHLRALDAANHPQPDLLALLAFPAADARILRAWHALAARLALPTRLERGMRLVHLLAACGAAGALRAALAEAEREGGGGGGREGVAAQLGARDALGRTALAVAAREGWVGCVAVVLEMGGGGEGVKVDARDVYGETPLMHAAARGWAEVVRVLVDEGRADVDARNWWGATPVWRAAAAGHADVVSVLLGKGAAHSEPYFRNSSPLAVARRMGHGDIIGMLRDAGAME
ncbi:hypothetical protein M1824_001543 [Neofusicoccum parvum]|uniref:Uncharacterized protein n=1 Tax=Neofusicoccum parvum TaxID=310453 RepID=A0ACB5RUQ3_9PEZI|nr:hypothetical protein M1824_001543 [Neofusicoccum parvum]